jgi:2-oxoisovalerate dehydrogenase E1 component
VFLLQKFLFLKIIKDLIMEEISLKQEQVKIKIPIEILKKAYQLMCTAKSMTELFEANKEITAKYVHATSRGHEAVQLALGLQLLS